MFVICCDRFSCWVVVISGVALAAPLGSVGRLLFWVWWVCLLRGLGWVAVGCLQLISVVGLLAVD